MAKKCTITFAASAMQDLEEIRHWYADQHVPETGRKLVAGILAAVERLADFPATGRIVPEFGVTYLREIIQPPFRIVYRYDKNVVRVVRVWLSERPLTA